MEALTVRTLADLDSDFELHADCQGCFRTRQLDRDALRQRLGHHVELDWILDRLRCRRCGGRNGALGEIYSGAGEFSYR